MFAFFLRNGIVPRSRVKHLQIPGQLLVRIAISPEHVSRPPSSYYALEIAVCTIMSVKQSVRILHSIDAAIMRNSPQLSAVVHCREEHRVETPQLMVPLEVLHYNRVLEREARPANAKRNPRLAMRLRSWLLTIRNHVLKEEIHDNTRWDLWAERPTEKTAVVTTFRSESVSPMSARTTFKPIITVVTIPTGGCKPSGSVGFPGG